MLAPLPCSLGFPLTGAQARMACMEKRGDNAADHLTRSGSAGETPASPRAVGDLPSDGMSDLIRRVQRDALFFGSLF